MMTILVVDDEAAIRDHLRATLADAGFHVTTAANGVEALTQVARRRPALVLCDLVMPGLNGLAFLQQLRGLELDIPVIVVTGLGEEELAVTCLEHGANDYVNKPVDRRELIARIQLQLRLSSRRVGYHPRSCGCGQEGCSSSRC